MGQMLIVTGSTLLLMGLVITFGLKMKPPLLPGDIFFSRDTVTVYFPIVTSLLVSIILSLIVGLFRR